MSSLNERQRSFENRYVHDAELRFRIEARRNRLAGLWAAERLGRTGADADAYAQEVVGVAMTKDGAEGVFRKLRADLETAGVSASEKDVRDKLAELLLAAERQITAE